MITRFIFVSAFMVLMLSACQPVTDDAVNPSGPYLGQEPPGDIPQVFAPGFISKGYHERGITFSPEGDELFYLMSDASYQYSTIVYTKMKNGVWSDPEIASFSGIYKDIEPIFSPDGRKLFFTSLRPLPGQTEPRKDSDIWMMERSGDSWGQPVNLGSPVNTTSHEGLPSVAEDGTLYFQARYDPKKPFDLYYAVYEDGEYQAPQRLPDGINTEYNEAGPFIAPDGRYLLFHSNRPGSMGVMDIYASYRCADGQWSEPVNLGAPVNSPASDFDPRVSPDGKYLFFSSYRGLDADSLYRKNYGEALRQLQRPENGYATIFWVDAGVIDRLDPCE
ncbi:MAG: PD40 domain-containing protein [Candidatus Zixiibacteriota bacterium]|nr:MAG: PD40 domain-containing protein [candidate division Zixibacteria bacterium]